MACEKKKIVYSTAHGRLCPKCGWPVDNCACSKGSATPVGDGNVRVGRETMGRKGKGVTIITGLPLNGEELKNLAGELKRKYGTGGTVKNGVIEIQGDHRDALIAELSRRGLKAKKSGG